ncbi:MAG: HDIG domain-containing protein [Actinobacteria bacterium]|nr:MAG: HDIG domain-containing protein [Actinomycetota bacterium]
MSAALRAARAGLAGTRAWLVGGAIRDRVLGRATRDLDVVVDGDPERAARAVARAAPQATWFALSERFGAWRVAARDASWQVDLEPLRGASVQEDLRLRDFTVNAIAEPIDGGAPIDPLGGLGDLEARRLRMAAPGAFADDPLRVLRLARLAAELALEPDEDSIHSARDWAGALGDCAPERVFAELRRTIAAPRALRGLELLGELSATAVVLPELEAMRGVEQSRFHHADVYEHTLETLAQSIALQEHCTPPGGETPSAAARGAGGTGAVLAGNEAEVAAVLAAPLADELSRGDALRWGALLHDIGKPATREVRPQDGRVTFIGHDARGAEMATSALQRLRASRRLQAHVAALVRHHLRLGFLVHAPQPLARRTVYEYLRACEPIEVDVTLLSVADRLATRGERAQPSIEAHLALARGLLEDALRWHREGPPAPLVRGDELAVELRLAGGPVLGALLEEIAEAQYAGELHTREDALEYARSRRAAVR